MNARELAAAIRKGHTMVEEDHTSHFGCAIGTIFIAVTGKNLVHDYLSYQEPRERGFDSYINAVSNACNAPRELIEEIERRHLIHGVTRLDIADWLDTL